MVKIYDFSNIIGTKHGFLTILKHVGVIDHVRYMEVKCDCGRTKRMRWGNIKRKMASCGCRCIRTGFANNKFKHGECNTRIYKIWWGIKTRIFNPNCVAYPSYGGRGIKIYSGWLIYENFIDWSLSNGYREDLTIERNDPNGNYEPNNCRWATMEDQHINKRNTLKIEYNGEVKTLKQWASQYGLTYRALFDRYKRNWPMEKMFQPLRSW